MSIVTMSAREMRAYVVSLVQREVNERCLPPEASYQEVVAALGLPPVRFEHMPPGRLGCRYGRQIAISRDITCPERIEFTVFHEILHILLDADGRIDSDLLEYLDSESDHYRWNVEDFCNLGAAEWMMPSLSFRQLMDGELWKLAALRRATDVYRCSLTAAAFQFAHWNPDPCHIVICEHKQVADQGVPRLEIQAGPRTPYNLTVTHTERNQTKYFMRRNVPVPNDHLIHRAWREKAPLEGQAQGFFRDPRGVMDCEAVPFGSRVFAVFYERKRRWMSSEGQYALDFGA